MRKLIAKLKVYWILLKAPDSVMIKFLKLYSKCYEDGIKRKEKTMIDQVSWYFEISEEANFASDENDMPAPCYCEFKLGFKAPVDETSFKNSYEEQAKEAAKSLSEHMKVPVEFIKVITKEEYLSKTEDPRDEE